MNIFKLIAILPLGLFILASAVPASAQSEALKNVQDGVKQVDKTATSDSATKKVDALIKNIVNIFSLIVGVVSVIMIIVGGFKYITSGGDSGRVSSAKNTIIYAVIGLIIVAFAQILVKFVIFKSTSK